MTVFTCPNCGAEVTSTDKAAVEYCLYCGSFVTLESSMTKIRRPEYIIPFKKTGEECRELYRKHLKRKIYAPEEFRDESYLNSFKGIFIPYWIYDYQYGPKVRISGGKVERHGDYLYKQGMTAECHVEGKEEIVMDASSSFDDNISSRIASFDNEGVRKFNPAYMFGFFADTADVHPTVYDSVAQTQATGKIWDKVTAGSSIRGINPVRPDTFRMKDDFQIQKDTRLSMLPVWFLTWKKGDRVAYSIVNGDTGETYAEVPIDPKRYFLISLITALPVFILLNLFNATFTGPEMIRAAEYISIAAMIIYMLVMDGIVGRTLHKNDLGYLSLHAEEAERAEKLGGSNALSTAVKNIILKFKSKKQKLTAQSLIIAYVVLISLGRTLLLTSGLIILLLIPAFFVYLCYRILKASYILKDVSVLLDIVWAVAALAVCILLEVWQPANDLYYYLTAIGCIAAVAVTVVRTVIRYNEIITRPVPHFFDREKGGTQ